MNLQLNNKSQKHRRFSPSVHISPDSRSSELERRSRSYDRDRSRSMPLALSVEGDTSLFSQSLWSALSSRHFSWDGDCSFSWVWDDLSLKEMRGKKISTCRVFKAKFYHFFLQNASRLKGEPLPLMPMRMGVRAVPLLMPVFPLSLSIPLTAFFSRMRGMVAPWTMGGWTASIPDKTKRKQVLPDRSHLWMLMQNLLLRLKTFNQPLQTHLYRSPLLDLDLRLKHSVSFNVNFIFVQKKSILR